MIQWLPKIVAVLLVIDAIASLFRPDLLKKCCLFCSQGAAVYIVAVIEAVIGAAFLFGASEKCNHQWVIIAFGILAFAGAVFIIAIPQKIRSAAGWFGTRNVITLRLFSLIYLIIGAILIYSA